MYKYDVLHIYIVVFALSVGWFVWFPIYVVVADLVGSKDAHQSNLEDSPQFI